MSFTFQFAQLFEEVLMQRISDYLWLDINIVCMMGTSLFVNFDRKGKSKRERAGKNGALPRFLVIIESIVYLDCGGGHGWLAEQERWNLCVLFTLWWIIFNYSLCLLNNHSWTNPMPTNSSSGPSRPIQLDDSAAKFQPKVTWPPKLYPNFNPFILVILNSSFVRDRERLFRPYRRP